MKKSVAFDDPMWHKKPNLYYKDTHWEFQRKLRHFVDKVLLCYMIYYHFNIILCFCDVIIYVFRKYCRMLRNGMRMRNIQIY